MPDAATDATVGPSSTTVTAPAPPPVQTQPSDIPVQTIPERPAPQAPPQPSPQQVAQVKDVAHHAMLGRAFKSIMGSHTEYEQTPQGPVPRDVPNSPGQLWRSILAGVVTGASAGADKHYFAQGAAKGAGAAQQGAQEAQERQRQQAQQQWENSLKAKKDQREENSAKTEDDVRRATIAAENARTAASVLEAQGRSYEFHRQMATDGKAKVSPYVAAGIKPVADGVLESDMTQYLKDHPGSSTLDWEPTEIKTTQKPDGTFDHQLVMSAYDPKTEVPVTPAFMKLMKDSGMDKYDPNMFQVVKEGKKLTPTQFMTVKGEIEQAQQRQHAATKDDLEEKEIKLRIQTLQEHLGDAKLEKNKQQQAEAAGKRWNALVKGGLSGPDAYEKLDPDDQRILGQTFEPLIKNYDTEIGQMLKQYETDPSPALRDKIEAASNERDQIKRLSTDPLLRKAAPRDFHKPPQPGAPIPLDVATKYLDENGGDAAKAQAAAAKDGWKTPPPPKTQQQSVQELVPNAEGVESPL